jgi:hypothetical protein
LEIVGKGRKWRKKKKKKKKKSKSSFSSAMWLTTKLVRL